MRILATTLLLLATLPSAAFACDRLPPENAESSVRSVNLSAAWPDSQILQNLKLQIGRADVTRKESSSSITTEYAYFHKIVTITRSASSGVQVKLVEKNQDTLVWKLGSCARSTADRASKS